MPPFQVTVDAIDPHGLARWWAPLLAYEVEGDERSDAFIGELLTAGHVTDADVVEIDGIRHFADAAALRDPEGVQPRLYFQRVPEAKTAKNRFHLDLRVEQGDLDRRVAEQVERGATFVEFGEHPGHRWAVMQDPEGNEFCFH